MAFLSLVIALLLEQARPFRDGGAFQRFLRTSFEEVSRHVRGHESPLQGLIVWVIVAFGAYWLAGLCSELAARVSPILQLAVYVGVLYLSVGFRQFSYRFTQVQKALIAGELERARDQMSLWLQERGLVFATAHASPQTLTRWAIRLAIVDAHRRVFACLFCLMLLPGPGGPLLFRTSEFLANYRRDKERASDVVTTPGGEHGVPIGHAADAWLVWPNTIFAWLDRVSAYLTAATFALVGNFEDTVARLSAAHARRADGESLVLAAASGALGMDLYLESPTPPQADEGAAAEPEGVEGDTDEAAAASVTGAPAEPFDSVAKLHSAVGLVWRSVVLCVVVTGLASLSLR